ncbi:MAG: SGNH/GDSL hydrolase family protein [Firmicutes bacterium]|nr:SGNH/GDSL hydrolase family protein [Bacillota bacterium]
MRRRYKLLLIIFISFLLVIFIYLFFRKDKFIYVSLGDELSFNNISTYNYREYIDYYYQKRNIITYQYADEYNPSEDLFKQIIENVGNINYYLKNADLITISLGTIELNNYKELNEEIIIHYLSNIYILLERISKLNKNIFLINVYDSKYNLVNKKIKEYCLLHKIHYIDSSIIKNNNIYITNSKTYLNYKGHKNIASKIIELFER